MISLLIHIGNSIPDYLYTCIKQYKVFNDIDLTLLLSDHLINEFRGKDCSVNVESVSRYYGYRVADFDKYFAHKDGFWNVTTKRLFIIDEFLNKNGVESVFHFENDIMVYFNIKKHLNTFLSEDKMFLTDGSVDKIMLGFSYLTKTSMIHLTNFINSETIKPDIIQKYEYDWLSDMTLLKIFAKEYPQYVRFLPILPSDKNYPLFNSLFDPASWGQYLGGTNNGHPKGFIDPTHIIGSWLLKNKYSVLFDEKGPRLVYEGRDFPIGNLHVHSKKLNDFFISP